MKISGILSTAVLAAGLSAGSAQAASIDVSNFSVADYNTIISTFSSVVSEDFEGFSEGNQDDGFSTAVGTFATVGGVGSGGTVTGGSFPGVNDGSKLAIRDGNVYGRQSTTAALTGNAQNDKFLDSNDTYGISWQASLGGSMFDQILLTLTDAADVGATIRIMAGSTDYSMSNLSNGNTQIVLITFDQAVSDASILFENFDKNGYRRNDGFSLDDIAISVVPLPASVLMLLAGLGGLGAVRKFRKA